MKKAVLILSWLLLAIQCHAEIITVDDDGPADFNNIQAAINDASEGDTLIVADGRYTGPGNYSISFKGKAITVRSANGPENCIIDCEGLGRGFYFGTREGENSVLDGFTITNGYGDYGGGIRCNNSSPTITSCLISNSTATLNGGGICLDPLPGISQTVANCQVTGNEAAYGGGVYLCDGVLSKCTITENTASYSGGGVYCADGIVSECVITGNTALGGWQTYPFLHGGGGLYLFYGTVSDCNVSNNSASNAFGGGVCGAWWRNTTVRNCTIHGNSSRSHGGGLFWCDRVVDCVITGNATGREEPDGCSGDGGGLYMCNMVANCVVTANAACDGGGIRDCPLVTNCIISGNMAEYDGGGVYYRFIEGSRIISCTISGNIALEGTGGGIHPSYRWGNTYPALTNCIVWGNTDSSSPVELAQFYATDPDVWFSCIQDDDPNDANIPFGGADHSNIDDDAMFVRDPNDGGDGWGDDPATPDVNEGANDDFGDLHITPDSPCINSGDPCLYIGVDYGDIDGQPRIMGFRADMGADEFLIPWITVTKPEEGEVWASGSIHEIEWESYGVGGPIDISYSATSGSEWTAIVDSMANTGNYVWHLPDIVDSNQCVISVVPSVPDSNVVIIDSGLFTIQHYPSRPPAPPGQIGKWDNFRRSGLSETYGPEIGCVQWQFETEGAVSASVSVGPNSTVYVPCEDGNLYKLDANGALLWSYDIGSPIISSPAVGYYGMIYVGGENGKLYAIDGKGQLRWTHTADGFVYSSAAVSAEGNVYVCSEDGKLYALGPDGSELWTFEIAGPGAVGSPIFASPSIGPDGTVYIAGLRDPNLYAIDPNDGSVKWACSFERVVSCRRWCTSIVFPWPFASPVVAADGKIYQTLLYDPNLYAVEPNTGSIMWSVELADVPIGDVDGWSEPAIGPDGTIYVSLNDPYLRAVEPNGNIKWVTQLGMGDGFTLTVGSDGRIYAAGTDGYLCVLETYRRWNREFPREIARFKTDSEIVFPVVPANDRIIFSDANNRIWAIGGEGCEEEVLALHRPEDVDGSRAINFIDFALFAVDWLGCNDPLAPCSAAYWDETYFTGDIDRNLYVDFVDLKALADQWLSEY